MMTRTELEALLVRADKVKKQLKRRIAKYNRSIKHPITDEIVKYRIIDENDVDAIGVVGVVDEIEVVLIKC